MQISFWIKKGPTDTSLKIRRFCVKPAGDILPPSWRKPTPGYPWGWSIEPNKKTVLTNDVIPEKAMELQAGLLRGKSARWQIEALDIKYRTIGVPMRGIIDGKGMKYAFRVPENTVFLRITWENDHAFTLDHASCIRIGD